MFGAIERILLIVSLIAVASSGAMLSRSLPTVHFGPLIARGVPNLSLIPMILQSSNQPTQMVGFLLSPWHNPTQIVGDFRDKWTKA